MSADPVRTVFARLARGPDAPDADLLARWAGERDEAAFAALVRRHGPMVLAVCWRLAPADADDAFQAVFLLLSRKAGRLRDPDRLGPWLHGVARRVARKAARRRGRERTGPLPEVAVTDPPADDLRAAVHEEVGRLPEADRAAVLLCDLEGVPRRAAASRLGIPDGTLSNRLTRARAMLGRRLVRRGIGLGGLAAAGAGTVPGELVAATVATVRTPPAAVLTLAGGGLGYGWLTLAGLAVVGALLLGRPASDPPPAPAPKPVAAVADPIPIKGELGRVVGLTLSPDGRQLYVAQWYMMVGVRPFPPARLTVFDTTSWQVVRRLTEPADVCGPVRFHPDGKTAFVVHPDRTAIHRVEVASWKSLGVFDPDRGVVESWHLSPDGKQLAVTHYESRVHKRRGGEKATHALWDAASFAHQHDLTPAPGMVRIGGYKPDGTALAVAYSTAADSVHSAGVAEIDPHTGNELQRFPIPASPPAERVVCELGYASDGGQLLAAGGFATPVEGSSGKRLTGGVWGLDRANRRMMPTDATDSVDYFRVMALSSDGKRLYLGGYSETDFVPLGAWAGRRVRRSKVQAWSADAPARREWEADGERWNVTALCPLPGGERLAVADAGGVWLFDAATGRRRGGLLTLPVE